MNNMYRRHAHRRDVVFIEVYTATTMYKWMVNTFPKMNNQQRAPVLIRNTYNEV